MIDIDNVMIHCRKCRKKTATDNITANVSKNNRHYIKGKCAVCGSLKSQFVNKDLYNGSLNKFNVSADADTDMGEQTAHGAGLLDNIRMPKIEIPKKLTKTIEAVKHTFSEGTRKNFPPQSRALLRKYGDMKVNPNSFKVCRHPISTNAMVKNIAKLMGRNIPHDDLFHLLMIFKTEDGTELALDKNEDMRVREARVKYENKPDMVCQPVEYNNKDILTLNQMLENTMKRMGQNKFWSYSSFENNCQDFQLNFMNANNLSGNKEWIKQDIAEILPKWAQKLADVGTDFKNIQKVFVEGVGVKNKEHPRALTDGDLSELLVDVPEYKGYKMMDDLENMKLGDNEAWIINTDDGNNGGTHWVVVINLARLPYVFYFDSFGLPPDLRIKKFILTAKKPVMFSGSQLQEKNAITCGYYVASMIKLLTKKNIDPYEAIMLFDQQPSVKNENLAITIALLTVR